MVMPRVELESDRSSCTRAETKCLLPGQVPAWETAGRDAVDGLAVLFFL